MTNQKTVFVKLPAETPDSCAECPLCGLIPKEQRQKGRRFSHVCIGTHEALTGQGIYVRASERDRKHPLSRPCKGLWHAWAELPGRRYPMNAGTYRTYRQPFEQSGQLVIQFPK